MALFLGYDTAECILNSPLAPSFEPVSELPLDSGSVDLEILETLDLSMFELPEDKPLDVVVSQRQARRPRRGITCHVSSSTYPHGAFLKLADGVYVASPALCLIQQAPSLSFVQRIMLAARLCGTYTLSKANKSGLVQRVPIASTDDMTAFAKGCPNIRGKRQALQALRWTLPNAASPMEAKAALPFYLPTKMGGYGFEPPTLNYEIVLSPRAESMTGTKVARIDIYWPNHDFGMEYQSEMFHGSEEAYGKDIGRQLAIESMNKTIRMVTLEQLGNPTQLEYLASLVASFLGIEFHPEAGKGKRPALIRDILLDPTVHSTLSSRTFHENIQLQEL